MNPWENLQSDLKITVHCCLLSRVTELRKSAGRVGRNSWWRCSAAVITTRTWMNTRCNSIFTFLTYNKLVNMYFHASFTDRFASCLHQLVIRRPYVVGISPADMFTNTDVRTRFSKWIKHACWFRCVTQALPNHSARQTDGPLNWL